MFRLSVLTGALLLIAVGLIRSADATASLDEALDRARTAPDELTVRDLTTIIESGQIGGRRLAWALNQRGFRHYMNGALDEAIDDFDAALRITPAYPSALGNRGSAFFERGEHEGDFKLLTRLQPDNAEAHYNLGLAYSELGFPVHAVTAFSEAIRLRPGFAWAYHNRGLAYLAAGQPWTAITDFDAALADNPGDPETLYARGTALDQVGKRAEAVESYSRIIETNPGHLAAYRNRAFARCKLGRVEDAVVDHVTWIAANPRLVQITERALESLGFEPGPVDGNLDEQSREAMRQWVVAGCP